MSIPLTISVTDRPWYSGEAYTDWKGNGISQKAIAFEIRIAPIICRISLYIYLHELGHVYDNSKNTRNPLTWDFERYRRECRAWEYARRCVKEKYLEEFDKVRDISLASFTGTHYQEVIRILRDWIRNGIQ